MLILQSGWGNSAIVLIVYLVAFNVGEYTKVSASGNTGIVTILKCLHYGMFLVLKIYGKNAILFSGRYSN